MNPIKIIATDLDGTLLDADMKVSRENAEAIHRLTARGIAVVPCTGRTYFDVPEAARNHPDIRYVAYSNGSVIYDKQTDSYERLCLTPDQNAQILRILEDYSHFIEVHHEGHSFLDAAEQTEEIRDFNRVTPYFRAAYDELSIPVPDLRAKLRQVENTEMILAFFHDDSELLACKSRLEAAGDLLVAQSHACNLEIFSSRAGKGNAIKHLAGMLGADIGQVVAVGDSINDLSMILAAGMGLATANACDTLKDAADAVICSNQEHVIPYIEAHYCAD